MAKSFHDFTVKDLGGNPFSFSDLKGKKVLIVNTASACMYTPQYAQMQELHDQMGNKVAVIAFPCNDFGAQEQGSHQEIQEFCSTLYGVNFPVMEKVKIKGDEQHEVYKWLTSKEENGVADNRVQWNFQKFLVDENGNLLEVYDPNVMPLDEQILNRLQE